MAQDTNLNTLIINKMTKAQYNAAEKSDSELYMVTDETYYTADEVDQKLANVSANLTGYAKETYVDQKVADLVGSSPDTLNTLNELASALGNDPNFATTITNQLAQKADKSYVDETAYKNSLPQISLNKPSKSGTTNTATQTYAKALARKTIETESIGVPTILYELSTTDSKFYFADDEHDATQLQNYDYVLYNKMDKENFRKLEVAYSTTLQFNGGKKYCYLRLICRSVPHDPDYSITINYIDYNSSDPMIKMTDAESSLAYNKTKTVTVNKDIIQNYSSEYTYDVMMDIPLGYMPYNNTGVEVIPTPRDVYFKIVYDDTLIFPDKSGTIALQEDVDLKANTADLAQVAKTGSFTDLNNIPSIPSVETTATENSTNAISSGYVYTLEDKLTNGTGGYKVMTAEYADNVPVISTNISTDAESDIKTTSPKAVKSYVDGNVVANPTLTGSETSLTSIGIGGTNFSVGGSSGGGLDFSNVEEIYSYHSLYTASGWKRLVNFNFVPKGTFKAFFVLAGVSSSNISDADMNDDSALIDKIKYSTYGYQLLPNFDSITYSTILGKGLNDYSASSLGGNQLRLTIDATAKKIYLDVNGASNSTEHNYAMKIYGIK